MSKSTTCVMLMALLLFSACARPVASTPTPTLTLTPTPAATPLLTPSPAFSPMSASPPMISPLPAGIIARISISSEGTQGQGYSSRPKVSGDGRFVTFDSFASNLVPGDTNNVRDIFVHDRETKNTTRVSVGSDGTQANRESYWEALRRPGDREAIIIARISISESYWPTISGDGRFVTFTSLGHIFVRNLQTGKTTLVSHSSEGWEGNGDSLVSSISDNGRFVAFDSFASNLVPDDTSSVDVFIWDRETRKIERISVASDGTQGNGHSGYPSISADGRLVAFVSDASNLVPGDTNSHTDIFVHDRETRKTSRVSVSSDGAQADEESRFPGITADGRYVAFMSRASNLLTGDTNGRWDIFVHNRETKNTTRVSVGSDGTQADMDSERPSISGDGRFVAFESGASNLVTGDTNGRWDIFVHDRQTGKTTRISVGSDGTQANGSSGLASISGDGRVVTFLSEASNLVIADTNGLGDIFVFEWALKH